MQKFTCISLVNKKSNSLISMLFQSLNMAGMKQAEEDILLTFYGVSLMPLEPGGYFMLKLSPTSGCCSQ